MSWYDAFTLKSDVNPAGATQELVSALNLVQGIFASLGQPFTITSLSEGQHVPNSKHYIGQAADLRINNLDPSTVPGIVSTLKSQLGPGYFVLLESDHIHVQYNGVGTALDAGSSDWTVPSEPDYNAIWSDPTMTGDNGVFESGVIDWGLLAALGVGLLAIWWMASD